LAEYKDVELTNGRVERVYRPPTRRIVAMVEKKHPRPQAPVVTETTKSGTEISMTIDDDPAYKQALAQWEETVAEEVDQFSSLFMFKDLVVPEDWDIQSEVGAMAQFYDPQWAPRPGPMGRKLDYIEWIVLGDVVNSNRVINALAELAGIDMSEVASNEASFRSDVERETS
jgi:hypothetical protein